MHQSLQSCKNPGYVAHVRHADGAFEHLFEVAEIAKNLAAKIAVPEAGELIGLLHDFGKYSEAFQTYISAETGLLAPDGDDQTLVSLRCLVSRSKRVMDKHSSCGGAWMDDMARWLLDIAVFGCCGWIEGLIANLLNRA